MLVFTTTLKGFFHKARMINKLFFHEFYHNFQQHVVIVLHWVSDGIVLTESGVLKHRAEVELESTMELSPGSALTFSEVNIGLSAVTLNTDFL